LRRRILRKKSVSGAHRKSYFVLFAVFVLSICLTTTNTFGADLEGVKKGEEREDGECTEGDCENGKGSKTFPDGTKYVGEFKNGRREGQGTYTFANGNKYIGEWEDFAAVGGWYYWPGGHKTWSYMDPDWEWVHRDSKP
jgi:hypothetical protein